MPKFRVTWQTEVDAESAQEAATKAAREIASTEGPSGVLEVAGTGEAGGTAVETFDYFDLTPRGGIAPRGGVRAALEDDQ